MLRELHRKLTHTLLLSAQPKMCTSRHMHTIPKQALGRRGKQQSLRIVSYALNGGLQRLRRSPFTLRSTDSVALRRAGCDAPATGNFGRCV